MRKNKYYLSLLLFSLIQYQAFGQAFTISENNRYILKEGKPFFWMGDTAWELFHKLDKEDANYYLQKRAAQGYNIIQAVALAELDGLNEKNANGDKPLIDNDPTKPNEAYFKHVDFIIDRAHELGMNIGFLPTWGDKLNKMSWGKGPEIFNVDNAKVFGKFLGERYKTRKNIIWILGGDRNPRPGSNDVEIWRAMASGIEESVGGGDKAMITYHPQPNRDGSSEWFHNEKWFDFNMFQTGHCRDNEVYERIKGSYDRSVIKPVIDGEPIYEDHPVCFNAYDLGTSNAYDVRKAAYLDIFSGAFGHTYGCHDIWQMYMPKREGINGPNMYWQQALDLPGANQMRYLKKLIESKPILERIPDQSLIAENNLNAYERIQATRGNDYAFIYSAYGRPFTLNLGKISGSQLVAYWYNPKNGETKDEGIFENKGSRKMTPPSTGYGMDWVLVIENSSKNFPKL